MFFSVRDDFYRRRKTVLFGLLWSHILVSTLYAFYFLDSFLSAFLAAFFFGPISWFIVAMSAFQGDCYGILVLGALVVLFLYMLSGFRIYIIIAAVLFLGSFFGFYQGMMIMSSV